MTTQSNSDETILARLRAATETSHAALNAKLTPLFDQGLKGYAEFLWISAQGVLTLERALEAAGVATILPDWASRSRAAALRADMTALGIAGPPAMDVQLPREEAYLYGVLYALECARPGARLLAWRVDVSEDARIRAASRYLHHGEEMDLWRTFLDLLETSAAVKAAPEQTVKGARGAFAAFSPGLGSTPRPPSAPLPRFGRS